MNWTEFFYMGGYAMFVWPSFALGFIVLFANVWWAIKRKQTIVTNLKRNALIDEQRS